MATEVHSALRAWERQGQRDKAGRSYYLGVGLIKYGRVSSREKTIRTLTPHSAHPTVKFKHIDMY